MRIRHVLNSITVALLIGASVFLVVTFIGERKLGDQNLLAQVGGGGLDPICDNYNTGSINRPASFPGYSQTLFEQSWTWRRTLNPATDLDVGVGSGYDYSSLTAAFAAAQSGDTIVVHSLPASELDGFKLGDKDNQKHFANGNPVHIYFVNPITINGGAGGGDVVNIDYVDNLVVDGMNNLKITTTQGFKPRAMMFIGHQTPTGGYTSTTNIIIKNIEIDGGYHGPGEDGAKWGLFGDNNTNIGFCNMYVHDIWKQHGLYFHQIDGQFNMVKSRFENVGYTGIQVRHDWAGNPNALYVIADNVIKDSCQGGAITADDASGTWWIHGNTITDSIQGFVSLDSMQQGFDDHRDGHLYLYDNRILMGGVPKHEKWNPGECNNPSAMITLNKGGEHFYFKNNVFAMYGGNLNFWFRIYPTTASSQYPIEIDESDNNIYGFGHPLHTGTPTGNYRMANWDYLYGPPPPQPPDANSIFLSIDQWKASLPQYLKTTPFDVNSTYIFKAFDPTGWQNLLNTYFGGGGGGSQPTMTVSATDAIASEPGTDTGTYTFSCTGTISSPITVNYTMSGSATNSTDYQALPGSQTITACPGTVSLTLTPINDPDPESTETAILTIAQSSSYAIGTSGSATVNIADDDGGSSPIVTISATDSSASEPGTDTGTFTIMRTGSTATAVTVNFTIATGAGQATNGTDYTTIPLTKTIPIGATSATVTVTPIDDSLVEGSETVILTLASGIGYTVGPPNTATVNIADNDSGSGSTVSISAADPNAAEPNNTGAFTITRTGSTASQITVNLTIAGSATNGTDYVTLPLVKNIIIGSQTATMTVSPIDDSLIEGDETVILTLVSGTGYTVGSANTATVTIADNDSAPPPAGDGEVKRVGNDLSTGTAPSTQAWVDTSSPSSQNPAFFTNLSTGSHTSYATDDDNFKEVVGTCSYPVGGTECSVTSFPTTPTCDGTRCATPLPIVQNQVTKIVFEYLPLVTIAATDAAASEPGTNTGTFTITRGGSTAASLTVKFAITGTATNGTDYITLPLTKIIPAGSSAATVVVTPIDDAIIESTETVILTISSDPLYAVGSQSSAIVNIADDDSSIPPLPTVTITVPDGSASEPGTDTGTIRMTRNGVTTASLTVKLLISGSAANSADYQTISLSQIIPAGSTSLDIPVNPIDDTLVEGDESVTFTLAADAAYTIGNPSAGTVTIADNDSAPTAPNAPSNLALTNIQSNRITLNWTDNANNEQGFWIQRKVSTGSFQDFAQVGIDAQSYNDTSVGPNQTYTYRVYAFNAAGNSGFSNEESGTTPPLPPGPSGDARLERVGSDGAIASAPGTEAWVDSLSRISANPADFIGLQAGLHNAYVTDVQGYGETAGICSYPQGTTPCTVVSFPITPSCDGTSCAATLTIFDATVTKLVVMYTHGQGDGGGGGGNGGSGSPPPPPPPPVSGIAVPAAPTNLSIVVLSPTQVRLSWTPTSSADRHGFTVELATDGVTFAAREALPAYYRYRIIPNLAPGTPYFFRLRAYNQGGSSDPSNVVTATTLPSGIKPFTVPLYRGKIHEEVRRLQVILGTNALLYPQGLTTGYFGILSETAVKRFQAKYGIPQVGVVGPLTRLKLNDLLERNVAP